MPASQPIQKARFGESPNQTQNKAIVPIGASALAFVFGNANAIATAPIAATTKGSKTEPMFRRAALATLASAAALVAACGHQVTPEPSLNGQGNNLAGSMLIRFSTVGPMNFSMYDYQVVIDACGGPTPYPNPANTSFLAYTFSFNIGTTQSFGASTVFPILLQYIVTPGIQNILNPQIVRTSLSETTLTPNDNGQNNEFTLTFPRALLYDPLGPTALPCSSSLASPSPNPTGTATSAPTPTATATAGPDPAQPDADGFEQSRKHVEIQFLRGQCGDGSSARFARSGRPDRQYVQSSRHRHDDDQAVLRSSSKPI